MFCINCGKKLTEKDQFCPECGKVNKDFKNDTKKMFCSNCGLELTEKDVFCKNCGFKNNLVKSEEKIAEPISSVETEQEEPVVTEEVNNEDIVQEVETKEEDISINTEVNNDEETIQEEIATKDEPRKQEKKKSKKWIFIILAVLLLIGIVVFVYLKFIKEDDNNSNLYYEKFTFEWDKDSDIKYDYVNQSKLNISVKTSDEKHANNIKYITNCGSVRGAGIDVVWDLTKADGKCFVLASYKADYILKYINVSSIKENDYLGIEHEIDYDSDEDLDEDGLTNKEEKEYNTNPEIADTDNDGLYDKDEIDKYKTDPTKKDTDNDGLNDYDEIELGLDPTKADSKGDGVKDGNRTLTYEYENDKVKVSIKGKGNIASLIANVNPNTQISNKEGLIDILYSFYTEGNMDEAIVTIKYTDEEIASSGLNEDNLSIYYYNEKTSEYEKIDSVVDKDNNTVTATLKHFSLYVLGDTNLVKEKVSTEVIFVIDNSWSMYSNEQYKQYTGEEYSGGLFSTDKLDESDADGVRFDLTRDLSKRLIEKNFKVGISEFRKDYAKVLPIGSSSSDIEEKLDNMMGEFVTKEPGTNSSNALYNAIDEFSSDTDNKVIVILTDGEDTYTSYTNAKVIEKANNNNVKICAIGFGEGKNNKELKEISSKTGCDFYSSNSVDGLNELFDNVGTELDDGIVDIDKDGKLDAYKIADSGFKVNRDGFSFENYVTKQLDGGHCYGMALFAELFYLGKLPLTFDDKTYTDSNDREHSSKGYDLTNTFFANFDNNLYDYKFSSQILKYVFGYEYFNLESPKEVKEVKDGNLYYVDKIKRELNNSKIYDIEIEESTLTDFEQIKKYGAMYSTYEELYLNEDNLDKGLKNEEVQLLKAITALFIKQFADYGISSGYNATNFLTTVFDIDTFSYMSRNDFINLLTYRISNGDPVAIGFDINKQQGDWIEKLGKYYHEVNAIDLYMDFNNSNIYYIGIYDSNYPNEKKYLKLECGLLSCHLSGTDPYDVDGSVITMTRSIANDLTYFE